MGYKYSRQYKSPRRILRERRICDCGLAEVQDEAHVIQTCLHMNELKLALPNMNFTMEAFFDNNLDELATFVFKALDILT